MRYLYYVLFLSLTVSCFSGSFSAFVRLGLKDDRYTYLLAVPLLSGGLILLRKQLVDGLARYCPAAALVALGAATLAWYSGSRLVPEQNQPDSFLLFGFAVAVLWIAGFVLVFGLEAARAVLFPLAFLFLLVPVSSALMHEVEVALQYGSADVSSVLFSMTGMPVFRQGLVFSLPGLDIQVAEECSGIRSSTIFWVVSAAAGYLFLRSGWTRLVLFVLTVPILIFKNAVRITTLSWLGVNVSRDILASDLHRQGGVPFGLIAVALIVPLMVGLYKLENRVWPGRPKAHAPE